MTEEKFMHILLINSNPVVSRLLALCTRDEDIVLEEVEDISSLERTVYDIVFVDEEQYKDEMLALNTTIQTSKKVLFSNEEIQSDIFDIVIKKPFLPSQILELLKHIETLTLNESNKESMQDEKKQGFIFPLSSESVEDAVSKDETQVLDGSEIEKIKVLLEMEEETVENIVLTEDEIEAKKIEVIKDQLISEGLEIVEEDKIVEVLSAEDTIDIFTTKENHSLKKDKKIKSKKDKDLTFTEKERACIEDAVEVAIASLKRKKIQKLLDGKKVKISIQLEKKQ